MWFQNRRTKHKRQKQEGENGTAEDDLDQADSEINYRERRLSRDSEDANIEDEMDTEDEKEEETPEVDINISNVVCNFSTRCHLNLRQIATRGFNVVYKREQGVSLSIIGIFKG